MNTAHAKVMLDPLYKLARLPDLPSHQFLKKKLMEAAAKELPVTVNACTTVTPGQPTPRVTSFLCNIDLTVVFMVDTVYFYSSGSEKAADVVMEALKQALVAFYPVAGRLRISDTSSPRLYLDCNSAGVPFSDASADVRIKELGDLSLPNPLFRNLVLTPKGMKRISDWPLLTIQITRFKCGGFSLGVSANHAICDGFGIIAFLLHFTSLARGEAVEAPAVSNDRTVLNARCPPRPTVDFSGAYYKSGEIPSTQSFSTMEDMLNSNLASNYVVQDLVSRTTNFSKDRLEILKKLAMADGTVTKCSTFDVLAAHLWKLRTAAIQMPPLQDSIMFMAMNISSKLNPPLPAGFLGNRAFPVFVKLTAEEVRTRPLSFCVKLIQDTMEGVDDEYVRSWIDWSELHRGIPKFNGGFYLSSWWKFPFYDMDFGMGKPSYMGPVLTQRVEFALILPVPPTRPNGGVDVLLTLKPGEMDRFHNLLSQPPAPYY